MKLRKISKEIKDLVERRTLSSQQYLKTRFKNTFKMGLDFNESKTLNEKFQWKKLYDHNPLYTLCADKYLVRNYIKKNVGEKYLIPLLFDTNNPEEIPFDSLNYPYIIKSNHGSGQQIIIRDGTGIKRKKICKICKKWLKIDFYSLGREWQYKNISRRIIIEKLLLDEQGKIPHDYKFHCFKGDVEFIQVDTDRFEDHKRSFFNLDWKLLPFTWSPGTVNKADYKVNPNISKPKNLNKMIRIAKKLSNNFDYVRVDLYSLNNQVYFGELTFTHGSGFELFFPNKWDKFYGNKLKISKNETKD